MIIPKITPLVVGPAPASRGTWDPLGSFDADLHPFCASIVSVKWIRCRHCNTAIISSCHHSNRTWHRFGSSLRWLGITKKDPVGFLWFPSPWQALAWEFSSPTLFVYVDPLILTDQKKWIVDQSTENLGSNLEMIQSTKDGAKSIGTRIRRMLNATQSLRVQFVPFPYLLVYAVLVGTTDSMGSPKMFVLGGNYPGIPSVAASGLMMVINDSEWRILLDQDC